MSSSSKCLCPLAALLMSCVSLTSVLHGATTQKTTRYEAEDATVVVGNIASWGAGYSGTGFVISPNTNGQDYLEWTVTAEAAGSVELVFGYTLGGSSNRSMEIKVNGVVVAASHSFPPTGGWDKTYQESAALTVTLNAGTNTIRARAISQGPQMDYADVKEILPLSGEVMTVYNGANLSGTSANVPATHVVHSGASVPGGLDNQISSFVLTEGYMAVVADSSDGTQVSKVYIAHDGPLTVNALPANLDNAISFIRVMPWKNTLKKGFCGGDDEYRTKFDHSWYYSWTQGVDRGLRMTGPEFAPMCWDEKYVQIDKFLDQEQVTHLLSFNEPDGAGQADMPVIADAIILHKELQKAGLRLGSPACEEQNATGTGRWLPNFMVEADTQGVRVDYINVHWYDYGGNPDSNPNPDPAHVADRLKAYLANVYARHRKPIWLTEFNANTKRPRSVHDGFLQQIMPYLDDVGYVERYAYYQWGDTMRFVDNVTGELTSTGQIYNDYPSSKAYVSLDLPSPWASADIGTTSAGASLYNGCFTISGSGVGLNGAADGCRYVYQPVSGDVTITAQVTGQIWRDPQSASGLMIREDLTSGSKQSSMTLSWSQGSKFRTRAEAGGAVTTAVNANVPKYPYWVRLVREGNTLTGYQSPDGVTWTQVGNPTTIAMTSSVYVGMAVTSHSDGYFNDAIFKNVSINVPSNNNAPAADAGSDQSVGLGPVVVNPIAGAYFEWDAANDTAGDNVWKSTTVNTYDWTFDTGVQSPVAVSDARFKGLTHAYPFPNAQDAGNTSFNDFGRKQAATFEFVIDVDGTNGSIFETGGSGNGMQVDIVGGVLRGTAVNPLAQVTYNLTPTDMGRFIHVAFVVDPTNDVVKLYVDGVLKGSAAWAGSEWTGLNPASLGNVSDSKPSGGSTDPFSGKMAMFRYYRNKAFSDADAQTNFAALTGLQAIATLDGSASDVDGDSIGYTWSFVSGPGWVSFSDVTSSNATATFTTLGVYTLRLTVYDYNGGRASDLVTITAREPTAYETWSIDDFSQPFTQTGATDNPDGDALTNQQEFAFGTDPTSPLISALSFTTGSNNLQPGIPTLMKLPVSGQPDAYHAVFSRRKNYTVAGLNYIVEFSADLTRWTASSAGMSVRSENSAGTMEAVSVPFPASVPVQSGGADAPPKFFRVGVEQ